MIWMILLLFAAPLSAANDSVATATSTASGIQAADSFTAVAAKKLGRNGGELADLRRHGFGKTEILSFAAIAKASKKTWDELVKERLQGNPLRKMAEEAGLDYDVLFEQSSALRDEIEMSLEVPQD